MQGGVANKVDGVVQGLSEDAGRRLIRVVIQEEQAIASSEWIGMVKGRRLQVGEGGLLDQFRLLLRRGGEELLQVSPRGTPCQLRRFSLAIRAGHAREATPPVFGRANDLLATAPLGILLSSRTDRIGRDHPVTAGLSGLR